MENQFNPLGGGSIKNAHCIISRVIKPHTQTGES